MKRYLHNKSHYHLISSRMGELTPVGGFEVLAGDTVQIQNSGLIRVSPPQTPVMHPVTVKFWNFFVPNRILDPGDGSFSWEKFITGGEDGLYTTPPPQYNGQTVEKGDVIEAFGIEPGTRSYNQFLPRGYAKIWNDYFRDQQLQVEIDLDTFTGAVPPLKVAWERDYFTSCRPDDTLGPEITLPIGTSAPVTIGSNPFGTTLAVDSDTGPQNLRAGGATPVDITTGPNTNGQIMFADLTEATGITVNELRESMALQRYQEARNLYGSRYTEYLRYLGISSSDGRLQRPELISTGKSVINFSEVLNTASDPAGTQLDPLGTMGGHGIAGVRSRKARYFCEEHGHIISLMAVRPKTMYLNTQHKMFDRQTKEDFWQKELQAIGMEPVHTKELYADAADPATVLGYNNRYESFKSVPSKVSGDFRDLLASWHLGRDFGAEPTLGGIIECDPSDRIYADTSPDNDKLWCTIRNHVRVRSLLRKSTQNRIL